MKASPFGQQLRHWRAVRGMSQLSLASAINGSARHLSFIETGRSRPGEDLVHRLADALGVPKRGRNELLLSAGFSPLYSEEPLEGPQLSRYRDLVERMLEKHRPYPATVIDRAWVIRDANAAAQTLFGSTCVGRGAIDILWELRDALENFDDVVLGSRQRLVEERFNNPDDSVLDDLIDRLDAMVAPKDPSPLKSPSSGSAIVTPRYRIGNQQVIETIMTVARFSAASHLELEELRVELIYPMDEGGERFFRSIDAPATCG
ncbi:MAG: helix-turn-helix domain-containing protein [Myxococcota bacterium]